jgi:hypothetical protein
MSMCGSSETHRGKLMGLLSPIFDPKWQPPPRRIVTSDIGEWAEFLDALILSRPAHAFYPMTDTQFWTVH